MQWHLAAPLVVTLGCGGLCDRGSVCRNDPPPSAQSVQACKDQEKALQNQACAVERDRFVICQLDNTECGSDGHVDPVATTATRTRNCAAATNTYQACCTQNSMSMACTR